MTAGFLAYRLWRLADAAMTSKPMTTTKWALSKGRSGGQGLIYLFLAWQAIRLITSAAPVRLRGTEQG